MTENPARTLVMPIRDDEILLGRKKQHHDKAFGVGKWNGFGGKFEPGETLEQAAIRECVEECGITPIKLEKVAELNFLEDYGLLGHVFFAKEWIGEPVETAEMVPKWFRKSQLPFEQMWDDDIFWLPAVLSGKKIRANFKFANNQDSDGTKVNPLVFVEMTVVADLW